MTDHSPYPTEADLDNWFEYHSPDELQRELYQSLRLAARSFAAVILYTCPQSSDRTDAIRKLRECVMIANASIACERKS